MTVPCSSPSHGHPAEPPFAHSNNGATPTSRTFDPNGYFDPSLLRLLKCTPSHPHPQDLPAFPSHSQLFALSSHRLLTGNGDNGGLDARDFAVDLKAQAQPDALNKWASINRFQVGDDLGKKRLTLTRHDLRSCHHSSLFKLGAGESVLEVSRDDFNRCSTAAPLATHKATAGGVSAATVPLPRSGPYYFVGGAPGSCQKGERLFLVVMSQKHSRGHHLRGLAPAPAPEAESPLAASFVGDPAAAPAPVTGAAGKTTGMELCSSAPPPLLGPCWLGGSET
ncbi:hypothetical protein HU200_033613 [Digitaria exilis]|uniref:Phytocyanin domain-containing protein n=1 Tax=Digitaria exilis TaxID=1010633 RepID=A0A835BV13_9POAL|nr:hypothetical protein HU200_033613 [Digitaria exilis]